MEEVLPQAVNVQDVGAASGHDASDVQNDVTAHVRRDLFDDVFDVMVSFSVISSKLF